MAERLRFALTLPPGWLALTPDTVEAATAAAAPSVAAASAASASAASSRAAATTSEADAANADAAGTSNAAGADAAGTPDATGADAMGTPEATGTPDATGAANGTAAARAATTELAAELNRALEQAARQQRPGRSRYVYLGVTGSPSVHAWAHLELAARAGATPEGLLAQVQAHASPRTTAAVASSSTDGRGPGGGTSTGAPGAGASASTDGPGSSTGAPGAGTASAGVRPWRREAAEAVLAGLPAVVVDDLIEVPSASGARLHRRILITLFPDDPDVVVQFQLSTPDLTAFEDALATALELVGSLQLTTPSEEPA